MGACHAESWGLLEACALSQVRSSQFGAADQPEMKGKGPRPLIFNMLMLNDCPRASEGIKLTPAILPSAKASTGNGGGVMDSQTLQVGNVLQDHGKSWPTLTLGLPCKLGNPERGVVALGLVA